ncbi:MAG: hypothetical protein Q7T71_14830 [Herbiconiux sp.]|nr:hypothetical protein [Herbiconiux sp.]
MAAFTASTTAADAAWQSGVPLEAPSGQCVSSVSAADSPLGVGPASGEPPVAPGSE